ncbi:MAG TPA: adenylate/guanylate cyclase domain-containing protein [Acidimicrobiia bacterium]
MSSFTRDEIAERAGTSVEEIDQLVSLGVIKPTDGFFSSADIRRVGIVRSFVEAGIPLDGLAEALASGKLSLAFVDAAAYDRFPSVSAITFEELSEQTGVPVELLMMVREVSGSAQPTPQDRVRDNELAVVPFIEMQVAEGFRRSAIERLLRATGDSLRRIAASEADWWYSEVTGPRVEQGMRPDFTGDVEFTDRISELSERALLAIYHGQQAHAWTRNIVEGFEMAMIQAGLHSRLDRPPAMCFLDITGYTRLTQERGDMAAAELAGQLGRLVERTSVNYGGRPVKWLGDGVMFWFRDPGPGVIAALDMVAAVASAGLPPAHVGLHAGPVVFQEGDYYGQTVNVASRIADYARPGEVLVSQAVVEASPDTGASFTEIGPVELKGVTGPTLLHSAHRSSSLT